MPQSMKRPEGLPADAMDRPTMRRTANTSAIPVGLLAPTEICAPAEAEGASQKSARPS
jgi:hypothetical protein